MPTISDLEKHARIYVLSTNALSVAMKEQETELNQIKEKYADRIKSAVTDVALNHEVLCDLVATSPDLFKKPKTMIVHGLRLGFIKRKGKLILSLSQDAIVAKLKTLFGLGVDRYVKTTHKLKKGELSSLPADQLKKLGISVSATGDAVVVKFDESDSEKFVAALLAEARGQITPATESEEEN